MNYSKPLTAAALAAGLVAVGAGVAAADDPAFEGEVVDQVEGVDQVDGQQIQLDTEGAGDNQRNRGRRGNRLSNVADIIGIEADELRAQLQDGATIAEVADANGVATDDLVDSIVADVSERLEAKVEAGDLTDDEAAERLEAKTERIENRVNGIEVADEDVSA